jgi:UDP-2,4-diacetamido-2,4,6-trideoxy-beta-L-altropyranose hydrolase
MIPAIEFRPVRPDDSDMLYHWANNPETRKQSFSTGPIPIDRHHQWFAEKTRSPIILFLIGMDGDVPVGTIRFELDGDAALVNFTVDPAQRGRGYGTGILFHGIRYAMTKRYARRFTGLVKTSNLLSMKCFIKSGFNKIEDRLIDGVPVTLFSFYETVD